MKNMCKFLLIPVLAIVFSLYMTDAVVAIANEEDISTGPALIEWLEAHKEIGGTVKLSDHVVLDGYYCYCPSGMNRPAVFVDTDIYTITVTGEIELMSDDHLTFSGQPDGNSIFYVAEKGALSMMGVAVESEQYALWQEEGAGLVMEDCHIAGQTHYADTPFVIYQNPVCVVVEEGQTVNDVLPTEISCTVNRQGEISSNEPVPLSWNLEGTEKQQAERLRFQLQGSFLQAASAEPPRCTAVYNDYPLTFTSVRATDDGARYTFQGGYTKPAVALPITVISEYSFDGENWIVYDEANVQDIEAGFFIGFRLDECDRAAYRNIYIRLQWKDNGTEYFSNVLCYAADDLEQVEDMGGSRGGGTSIINPPENPEKSSGDESPEVTRSNPKPTGRTGSDNDEPDASSDTDRAEGGDSNNGSNAANGEESLNAEAPNVNTGQLPNTESSNTNEDRPSNTESKASNTGLPSYSEPKSDTDANEEGLKHDDSGASEKEGEAVTAISTEVKNSADPPRMKEQALRPDIREGNAIMIAAGFVLLSVIAGIVGFCVHSRSGTNR